LGPEEAPPDAAPLEEQAPPAEEPALDAAPALDAPAPELPPQGLETPSPLDEPAAEEPDPFGAPPVNPQGALPPLNAPILTDEDAPPALPASLRHTSQLTPPVDRTPIASAQPRASGPLTQPPSVQPDAAPRVSGARASAPVAIQLVNPAAAVVDRPRDQQLEQAIYYEASDRATNPPRN
jgi:hypothetical protein